MFENLRFQLIEHEEYQSYDKASSSTTTYIRGRGYLKNESNFGFHIFDTSEYVVPPSENEAVFIMTNFVKTYQELGQCDEVFHFIISIR